MAIRVGIDLVSVQSIEESLRAHAESYLARVYTEREIADCGGMQSPMAERLAGRFAAKEATIKVLRPDKESTLPWSSIEVVKEHGGWVTLRLSAQAAALADLAGIQDLQLSLAHEGLQACAVVIAEMRPGCR